MTDNRLREALRAMRRSTLARAKEAVLGPRTALPTPLIPIVPSSDARGTTPDGEYYFLLDASALDGDDILG
jgi:hypothetical protein